MQVIIHDIGALLLVLAVIVVGVTFYFVVSAPFSEHASFYTGPLWPLVTVLQTVFGVVDESFYACWLSIAMLLFFLFFVVLIMHACLLAQHMTYNI